jgi:hypothetical protein
VQLITSFNRKICEKYFLTSLIFAVYVRDEKRDFVTEQDQHISSGWVERLYTSFKDCNQIISKYALKKFYTSLNALGS